jgi:AcrR family transcriptional regulator
MARPTTKLEGIERAAMQLFSRHGLAKVTIRDIAEKAHCAEGSLYRHYDSKEKMAWTLFSREMGRFGERLRGVLQGNGTWIERIPKAVRTFYHFYDEDPVTFRFILLAQHDFPREKPIPEDINPNDLVMHFIREGIETGQLRHPDPALAACMVLGLVLQPATMHIYNRLKGSMLERADSVAEACIKVLGVDDEIEA